jgi:hypothetical protein
VLQDSSTYLTSVPLRVNHLPSVDEHLRVEWEVYPVWGLHHGFVGTDEFYQFPVPKSRHEVSSLPVHISVTSTHTGPCALITHPDPAASI